MYRPKQHSTKTGKELADLWLTKLYKRKVKINKWNDMLSLRMMPGKIVWTLVREKILPAPFDCKTLFTIDKANLTVVYDGRVLAKVLPDPVVEEAVKTAESQASV